MSGFLSELKIAKHYYDHDRTGPVTVDLHPTLACQNKCYFCISENFHVAGINRPNFSRKHSLDWPFLKSVIQEWRDMKVKAIQLTGGGEPSLYYKFPELLEEIKDFNVGMITNGILLKKYAAEVYDSVDWVRISLDASNREMYKNIKSVDNFDKVIDSLKTLSNMELSNRPRIGVAYIITPESIGGIVEVSKLIDDIGGVDYLQFKNVLSKGTKFTDEYQRRITNDIETSKQLGLKVPIFYTTHEASVPNIHAQCFSTDYVSVLGADGNVYSCCHLEYIPQYSNGSIYKESFKDIWEHRKTIKVDTDDCWNCRFTRTNAVINALNNIQDGDFV